MRNIEIDRIEWRYHLSGMLMGRVPGTNRFLHVWSPSLWNEGLSPLVYRHNHRRSFRSEVLLGEIVNERFSVSGGGPECLWEIDTDQMVGRCTATQVSAQTISAGESYSMDGREYHGARVYEDTITLIECVGPVGDPARYVVPEGRVPPLRALSDPVDPEQYPQLKTLRNLV